MKYTAAIATVIALVATVFNDTSSASPLQQIVDTRQLASNVTFNETSSGSNVTFNETSSGYNVTFNETSSGIQKRDAFTCHGSSNATVSDCRKVIDAVRRHGDEVFRLRSGLCLSWREGTCGARFCAVRYVQWPLNRTADWVADYLTAPLLDDCVSHSSANGVMGDSLNINSNAGTYRLHLEQFSAGY